MKPGVDILIQQIAEIPGVAEVVKQFIPLDLSMLASNPQTKHLSLRQIIKYSKGRFPPESIERIDAALTERFGTSFLTEAEKSKIARYQAIAAAPKGPGEKHDPYDAFYPGKPWLDTEGKRIQAHGGAILEEDGWFYWYGENKEHTKGTDDIWTWGVKAYNWEDLGQIISPVLDDPDSVLFPDTRVDRPHILRCGTTGKYVCWIHLAGKLSGFLILQADAFLGPYVIVNECYRPEGYDAGDFDLVKAEDGSAYLFYDIQHSTVLGMKLSDDYLRAEKIISRQYEGMKPPFCREGIAVFEREGKMYMLSSGMTGYVPNRSDAAESGGWEIPFESVGDPYPGDDTHSSP